MKLQKLTCDFTVCKIATITHVAGEFVFLTDDEILLVCESAHVPQNAVATEPNWKGLKIAGVLDFGMIGVIAKVSNILARAGVSIFVVSTYNTDYIFVKAENYGKCIKKLFRISILISLRLIFRHFTFALPRRYTPNMRRQRKSKLTKKRSKIYQKRDSKQLLRYLSAMGTSFCKRGVKYGNKITLPR